MPAVDCDDVTFAETRNLVLFPFFSSSSFFFGEKKTGTRHQPCKIYIRGRTPLRTDRLAREGKNRQENRETQSLRKKDSAREKCWKYIQTRVCIGRASAVPRRAYTEEYMFVKRRKWRRRKRKEGKITTNSFGSFFLPTGIYIASERVTSASGLDTSAATVLCSVVLFSDLSLRDTTGHQHIGSTVSIYIYLYTSGLSPYFWRLIWFIPHHSQQI